MAPLTLRKESTEPTSETPSKTGKRSTFKTQEERAEAKRIQKARQNARYTKAGVQDAMKRLSGEELTEYLNSAKRHQENRRKTAVQRYKDKKSTGWKRTRNPNRAKQFTKESIKRKQGELQGEELAAFNKEAEDFKKRQKEAKARHLQKKREEILAEKAKESHTNKHFSQAEVHKANRAALDEIPYSFQPNKKPKQS